MTLRLPENKFLAWQGILFCSVELDVIHVKHALACGMSMEKKYFSSDINFALVCSICGDDIGILIDESTLDLKGKT